MIDSRIPFTLELKLLSIVVCQFKSATSNGFGCGCDGSASGIGNENGCESGDGSENEIASVSGNESAIATCDYFPPHTV